MIQSIIIIMVATSGTLNFVEGFYLMGDYYMDMDHSKTFGGVCGDTIMDDSFYLNSHLNNLKLSKYPKNNDCWMIADAGTMSGARYTFYFEYMDLQEGVNGSCINDYLVIIEGLPTSDTFSSMKYCGQHSSNGSTYWLSSKPKLYIKFYSDATIQKDGFKIKFVRSEPLPCQSNEWLCRHENRCIDSRLKCDGTPHCYLGDDEQICNAWENLIGKILALGLSGVVGVSSILPVTCCLVCLFIVIKCCCKKCTGKRCCTCALYNRNYNTRNVRVQASTEVKNNAVKMNPRERNVMHRHMDGYNQTSLGYL